MSKRKKYLLGAGIVLSLVFIFKIISITASSNTLQFPLGQLSREIMAPIQEGLQNVTRGTGNFFAYFSDNRLLREKSDDLEKRVLELEEEVYQLKEQQLENERLREMLAYQKRTESNYVLEMASVIGRNPSNWYQTLIIDKGANQGIQIDMTVINHQGLVGRVIGVSANTSEILLVLDKEGAVGARIFETRVAPGVVEGTGNSQKLNLIHIPHDVPVEKDQTVVTSGLGGIFPKGIRIGKITDVHTDNTGLIKTANIEPVVDFNSLEEVFVIRCVIKPESDEEQVFDTGGGVQ